MRSFEDFAQEVHAKYQQESAAKRQGPFFTHSTGSKARLLAAGFRPKALGADKNIAVATVKMIDTQARSKPSMTGSKTSGDMSHVTQALAARRSGREAKVGWRRPSYLKAQEEVLASEIALNAERRARVVAASQKNARRSDIGSAVATSPAAWHRKVLPPTMKPAAGHGLPRKSSGSSVETGRSAEMLKRVFSGSLRGVRRIGRSFTGMSGSGDG